jgi:glycosyltransferase involved in cell wall biosynthesis
MPGRVDETSHCSCETFTGSLRARGANAPFVSVIVPVFNDPDRLALCLQALEGQTYPKDLYEIIVVDNGSDEPVGRIVSEYGQSRLCEERLPGSYAARNKGISLARGEIIAFTDADCIPYADWIEAGAAALGTTRNCGLVAGRVDVFFEKPDRPTSVELYDGTRGFLQQKYVEVDRYGATANLFTWQSVFAKVGLFNDALRSYGDVEWGRRVDCSGYQLAYCDKVAIRHPARRTWRELYSRISRVTGGLRDLTRMNKHLPQDYASPRKIPATLIDIWRDPRLDTATNKLRVVAVAFVVQCMKIYERIRLHIGWGR